jgi:hypothetical protein
MEEPQKPTDSFRGMIIKKRIRAFSTEIIQDAKKYGAPNGSFREINIP